MRKKNKSLIAAKEIVLEQALKNKVTPYQIINNKYFFRNQIDAFVYGVKILNLDNPEIKKRKKNNFYYFILEKK